jgi:hypothetical protein
MPCDEYKRLAELYVQTNKAASSVRKGKSKDEIWTREESRPMQDLSKQARELRKERDNHLATCEECQKGD